MSTRSNIYIKSASDERWLYRHSDGYPSGLGQELKTFLSDYKVPFTTNELADKINEELYAEDTCGIHSDIEYLYHIYIDSPNHCTLSCYDVWKALNSSSPIEEQLNIDDFTNLPLMFSESYGHTETEG